MPVESLANAASHVSRHIRLSYRTPRFLNLVKLGDIAIAKVSRRAISTSEITCNPTSRKPIGFLSAPCAWRPQRQGLLVCSPGARERTKDAPC
jgi:hypothetical protein